MSRPSPTWVLNDLKAYIYAHNLPISVGGSDHYICNHFQVGGRARRTKVDICEDIFYYYAQRNIQPPMWSPYSNT